MSIDYTSTTDQKTVVKLKTACFKQWGYPVLYTSLYLLKKKSINPYVWEEYKQDYLNIKRIVNLHTCKDGEYELEPYGVIYDIDTGVPTTWDYILTAVKEN